MLFNSLGFLFAFLPAALLLTWLVGRWNRTAAKLLIVVLSLIFYGVSDRNHLPLLLASFALNYAVGEFLLRANRAGRSMTVTLVMAATVTADLIVLIYYKYLGFIVANIDLVSGLHLSIPKAAMPLAVSFFTFQEIAYVVDAARGETHETRPLDYAVFVAFFSKLISGPIVRFAELVPQIENRRSLRVVGRNVMVGLVQFSMGLFKKTVIADSLAPTVDTWFKQIHAHAGLPPQIAWLAAVAYMFQLYFDFSGYTDMALGLARMFGLKLPLNFHSPYRARSIMEYWRRWHMTLQRFAVSYIFQPMAIPLNRLAAAWDLKGWPAFIVSTAAPVFLTFLILGVWHGAGWAFVVYGLMHGVYVSTNEIWRERALRWRRRLRRAGQAVGETSRVTIALYHVLTLTCVLLASTMFRASTVHDAVRLWAGMIGAATPSPAIAQPSLGFILMFVIAGGVVFLLPNTQQILGRFDPAQNWDQWRDVGRAPLHWTWKPNAVGILFAAAALFLGFAFSQAGVQSFVYFNF